jgi:hypothetical protein
MINLTTSVPNAFRRKSKTGRIWESMEYGVYWISLPYICFPNHNGYWFTHTIDMTYTNGPFDSRNEAMDSNRE